MIPRKGGRYAYLLLLTLIPILLVIWFARANRQESLDTALIGAIQQRNVALTDRLLKEGASADAEDTPTRLTFNEKLRRLWLRIQGKPVSTRAVPALIVALSARENNGEIVHLLLAKGATTAGFSPGNRMPFLMAPRWKHAETTLEELIAHGGNTNQMDADGFTPLMAAAQMGNVGNAKILLNHGAQIDARMPLRTPGYTPLLLALEGGGDEMAVLLLDRGADYNRKSPGGRTLAMFAAKQGYHNTIKWLLVHGTDINAKDANGLRPISWAVNFQQTKMIRYLAANGARLDFHDYDDDTLLHLPAWYGYTETVKTLLDLGLDVNAKGNLGTAPLIFAASGGHEEIVRQLLEKHCDVNAQDNKGSTALMATVDSGSPKIVRMLLAHEADPRLRNRNGMTALQIAKSKPVASYRLADKMVTVEEMREIRQLLEKAAKSR